MGQRLRASEAPSEDPDLIPDTHMVAQTMVSVTPIRGDQTIYAHGAHTCMQAKHS